MEIVVPETPNNLVLSEILILVVSLVPIGWNVYLILENHKSFIEDASSWVASWEALFLICLITLGILTLFYSHPHLFYMPGPARLTRDGVKFQRDIFDYLHSVVYFGFLACLGHKIYVLLLLYIQSSHFRAAFHMILLLAFSAFTVYLILPLRYPFQTHKLVQSYQRLEVNAPNLQVEPNQKYHNDNRMTPFLI